jgi:predicted permease
VGRAFAPDSPGIVISYGFWQRRFGGDPAVIGKTLPVAGAAIPIVGVAPRNFRGLEAESLEPPNMWIPFSLHKLAAPAWIDYGRGMHWWEAVGRLKPGVTLAEAQAAVSGVSSRLAQEFPGTNREWRAKLVPLNEVLRIARSPLVNVLVVLSVVAGVVLLITCANLANLLLARGWRRSREMALRVSLGATRGRLLGQLLTESVLLAVFSGVVGWMLSVWTSGIQGRFYPLFRSGTEDATDARRLLFALVASVLTGILFGVAPAWQASRMDSYSTLKGEHSNRRGRYGMRNALITAQVSLSLLLLIGAGLFLTTLRNVRSSDVTFAARNVLLADIELVRQRYTVERAKHFWPQLLEAVRRLPGVNSTSLVLVTPHAGRRGGNNVIVGEQRVQVDYNMVASDYFQTIGIPLVRGRDFNDRDDAGAPPRVIVNEEFARRFWPGEDPIGKTFRMEYSNLVVEAVGVVRDGKFRGFRSTIQPCFYRPFNQETRSAPDLAYALTLEVRTAVEPHALVPTLRKAAARLDPDLPLKDVRTWQEHIARSMARETMLATLLSGLGLLAVLLASIGTYGVVSFAVAQRAREMGIRIALGASRAKILCDVIGGVLFPVSVGIVVGAAGAQALTRFVKSMLYGVSATDITVFSAVIAIELSVALTAAYLPARRATKIDPLEALRHE